MDKLKIGYRLAIGFGSIILVLVLVVSIGLFNFNRLLDANRLNVHTLEVINESEQMLSGLLNIQTGERGFLATGREHYLEPYENGQKIFTSALKTARSLTSDNPSQQQRLEELSRQYQGWLDDHVNPVIQARRAMGSVEELPRIANRLDAGRNVMNGMRGLIAGVEADERILLEQRQADVVGMGRVTSATLIGGALIGALLATLAGFFITRSIVVPLQRAIDITSRVADGDLTADTLTTATDETGQLMAALGRMTSRLKKMMTEIGASATQLASSSEEMSATSDQTLAGAERQRGDTEQVATAINQMSSTVQEVSRNTQDTSDAARSALAQAQEGRKVVNRAIEAITSLSAEVQEAASVIGKLEAQSESIGQVLTVIRNIAGQTNLLALNAAIEAARAGEHGRGFAVVADEVRNLASNTEKSIGEIDGIIEQLQSGTQQAVLVMRRSTDSAATNVNESQAAARVLEEISESVGRITDMATQVASAVEEQSAVAEDINRNITSIKQVSEETSSAIRETANATLELSTLATQLQQLVARFKIR